MQENMLLVKGRANLFSNYAGEGSDNAGTVLVESPPCPVHVARTGAEGGNTQSENK